MQITCHFIDMKHHETILLSVVIFPFSNTIIIYSHFASIVMQGHFEHKYRLLLQTHNYPQRTHVPC